MNDLTEELFLSMEGHNTHRRFKKRSDEEINNMIQNSKPKNTEKSTKWCMKIFNDWKENRPENIPDIVEMTDNELNSWLARFISEACKVNGEEYPAKTLYLIACGILRHLRDNGIQDKNILDFRDNRYTYFTNALDSRMKDLTYRGIGIETKQADVFSEAEEVEMWQKGVFGNCSSEVLQYTLYFYNCKLFGLRGREEHHDLQVNDFIIGNDSDGKVYIKYTSRSRKNFNGGLRQIHFKPKVIKHYDTEGRKSIISLYREYFQALGETEGPFYLRTLPNLMNSIRFGKQRVGVNTLSKILPILAARANLKGNYTSHSGKATCATRLSENSLDDKIIKKRLGNRSSKGLEAYKRRRDDDYNASIVLNPPEVSPNSIPTPELKPNFEDLEPTFFSEIMECGPPPQSSNRNDNQNYSGIAQPAQNFYNCYFYVYRK